MDTSISVVNSEKERLSEKQASDGYRTNSHSETQEGSKGFFPDSAAREDFAKLLAFFTNLPEPEQITCPCCGGTCVVSELERFASYCCFTSVPLSRVQCPSCKVIMGPLPLIQASKNQLTRLYELLYRFYREGFSTPFQEKTFYLLNPSRFGRYLNYACGDWGIGLQRLRDMKWDVVGYEPIQNRSVEYIFNQQSVFSKESFDGLFSHNFIEHLQSPEEFFRECWDLLQPGGIMVHSTPCYEYLYHVAPLHLYFFCESSLQCLAERVGFRFIQRWASDGDIPGSEYIAASFRKPKSSNH
jgi:hypothetical protein